MSDPKPPMPVRPVANCFYTDDSLLDKAISEMDQRLGRRCFSSDPEPFTLSKYYEKEMGTGIKRVFVAWEKLVDPIELIDIKLLTWNIEKRLKADGRGRAVNIDPGIISERQLLLATGKAVGHRPYIGKGVYIDITLIYESGTFQPLKWTYPDYAGEDVIGMMNRLRTQYMIDRKKCIPPTGIKSNSGVGK